ncbi:HAMP domain-containing sensor histidine kinase [Enterococcus raffinosus]|uniref:sensor histidine kinase n=1 Tax=Enterococcus raffinosus TaxID=71452 RepID=UPI001C46829B|nr:HAMP domain-containing sensor histidine kinase [Enterococcus raffinosus]MDT2572905.1 HAMP domain-containing sensor histidine kinase [Enterococcus raffinosus]QXJ59321.1 HAMP domain-containing histidine kinase [Enterococcus raffinosus]
MMILSSLCLLLAAACLYLVARLRTNKQQIAQAMEVLEDIGEGNLDRKIIADEGSDVAALCFRLNEIVVEIKQQLSRLQVSEKEYRQLITSLSHDVRTPLASLIGYLEAINDGLVTEEEQREYLQASQAKAFELEKYIDTLFEWVKLESGERRYQFETHDVAELLRELVSEWIPRMEPQFSYDIQISEKELYYQVDFAAFRRIVDNLLENSMKHSQGNKLTIKLTEQGQLLQLEIGDNGKGISEKNLPRIFDRLYKGDEARGSKGNGLGLAIVQELVAAHHGTITASSKLGEGTTFHVRLPK